MYVSIKWRAFFERCPAEYAALRESVKHNLCRRITTLYLLNYMRVRADEHGSYIRLNMHLTLVELGLTEVRTAVTTPW
jgi:hypothetical protein